MGKVVAATDRFESGFEGPWPQVLEDMLEFARLTCLRHAKGRPCQVLAMFAKPLVPPHAVQPAVNEFCALLMADYRGLRCIPSFEDRARHALVVNFGR